MKSLKTFLKAFEGLIEGPLKALKGPQNIRVLESFASFKKLQIRKRILRASKALKKALMKVLKTLQKALKAELGTFGIFKFFQQ